METPTELERWNELTPELKLECIKSMDFLQRLRFRASSKAGKATIEMQRFNVKQLSISDISYGVILELNVNDEEKFKIIAENDEMKHNQIVPLLVYVLKCGNIDELISHESEGLSEEIINKIREVGPFQIKKVDINDPNIAQNAVYLERCTPETLKSADLGGIDPENIRSVLEMESLSKIEALDIGDCREVTTEIAEYWIEKDEEIGRKMKVKASPTSNFTYFGNSFQDRIVSREERLVRIRTDNSQKHILLKSDSLRGFRVWLQMFVIPSSLLEGTGEYKEFFENNEFE